MILDDLEGGGQGPVGPYSLPQTPSPNLLIFNGRTGF